MNSTLHSFHRHLKGHINDHHKHYLFGIFGGFALFKLFLLLMGLGTMHYTITNAQLETGCTLTGQYYTGEYQTGCIDMPEEFTGGYLVDCQTIPGYYTGGIVNESGDVVDQIRIEETQTGCVLTGQTIIPAYTTGCFMTGGYRTGGTLLCNQGQGTEDQEQNIVVLGNGVCDSGDIIWSKPISGSIVRNIFDIQWNYSGGDCLSGLSLQLWDHNAQWVSLVNLSSGTTSYAFDSKKLYGFQYSGLYHIIGNTGVGNFMLYQGMYTGSYSRFFTGYKLKLLASDQTTIQETGPFTIDNQYPIVTGMNVTSSGVATGYTYISGVVTLSFTASEALSGVVVTLGSGKLPTTSTVSNLTYTYTRTMTSLYSEGPIVAYIAFSDVAGNTGSLVYTSALIFDMTIPTITGFIFSGSSSDVYLSFTSSELVKTNFSYWNIANTLLSGTRANYLTAHQLIFSGIQANQLYMFRFDVVDQANNSRSVTGDFILTSAGDVASHLYVVPLVTTGTTLSGTVATLTNILKNEVEKYNACKNALGFTPIELEIRRATFTIQMPNFRKSQVKILVNAFTLFVLDNMKNNYQISSSDIEDITKKFDSFLVVLKLLRDDDNSCKQNLSNYHINQFKQILTEYNIAL